MADTEDRSQPRAGVSTGQDPTTTATQKTTVPIIVVAVLLFASLARAVGLSMRPGLQTGQRVLFAVWALASVVGVILTLTARQNGGFGSLVRMGRVRSLDEVRRVLFLLLYNAGSAGYAIGGFMGVILLIDAALDKPTPYGQLRQFSWAILISLGGGFLLRSIVERHGVTVRARIGSLSGLLNHTTSEVHKARTNLAMANSVLESIDKDLNRQFRQLEGRRAVNDALAEALRANPETVKAVERVRARERKRGTLLQGFSLLVAFFLGYVVNWTSAGAWEWLKSVLS